MRLLPFISFASLVAAGQLTDRALLYASKLGGNEIFAHRTPHHEKRRQQEPLIDDSRYDANSRRRWARLEIESASFLGLIPFYWTSIALGTPNQPFRAILDTAYGGAVVRSEYCLDMSCARGFNYSSSASSTYHDEKERFLLHLPAQFAYGNVSKDHMQLAGVHVPNVTFGPVDDFHGENYALLTMALFADGALGLGPPQISPVYTETEVPNMLYQIFEQGNMESKSLTLEIPYYEGWKGAVTFGVIPEEASQSHETRIPLSNSTESPMKDMWHFDIDSLEVAGANSTVISPIDAYATFDLGHGFSFPKNMTEDILAAIDAEATGYLYPEVNCSRWEHMPDLVFTFAGQQVTLERDDYAFKGYSPYQSEVCLVTIAANYYEWQPISFGVEFMRKFYVTFDMDQHYLRLFSRAK